MNKATFVTQLVEFKDGEPVRDAHNRIVYTQVEDEWVLPPGWEFLELDEIEQPQVVKFEKLFAKSLQAYIESGYEAKKGDATTRQSYSEAVVNAAIEAGFFESVPDKKPPKAMRWVAAFIDAYKTDLDIIPENLS